MLIRLSSWKSQLYKMRLSAVVTTLAVAITATEAVPLDILNFFYKRADKDGSSELPSGLGFVGANASNSSSSNGTNGTSSSANSSNSSTSAGSGLPKIQLYSISENFTDLYENKTTSPFTNLTLYSVFDKAGIFHQAEIAGVKSVSVSESGDVNSTSLLELKKLLEADAEDIDGSVILAPASVLEDVAFFLDITTNTTAPIVVVQSVSSIADTSLTRDVVNAVLVASDEDATSRHALVVDNNLITSAFWVEELATSSSVFTEETVGEFGAVPQGSVGSVYDYSVQWFYDASELPTSNISFSLNTTESLPSVVIVQNYNGFSTDLIEALKLSNTIKGLVFVTSSGDLTSDVEQSLEGLDVPVVIASDKLGGFISPKSTSSKLISAGLLDSVKARLLLQVSLASKFSKDEIADTFKAVYGGH